MTYRSIWHGDGGRHVLLRSSLTLDGPCRDGRLTCASSGPFQLYINGMRVAGAPGGAATETPLWYPRHVSGAWDAGPHELVVVADGGPDEGERWFAVHGELTASASGTTAFTVESGLHWHALELPPAPTGTLADERFSALEDPRTEGRTWEGVVTVDATADDEVPVSQERQIEAREFAAFEETEADADLTFSPARVSRHGKFVHRDGLLAGPAPAASLQTAAGGPSPLFSTSAASSPASSTCVCGMVTPASSTSVWPRPGVGTSTACAMCAAPDVRTGSHSTRCARATLSFT